MSVLFILLFLFNDLHSQSIAGGSSGSSPKPKYLIENWENFLINQDSEIKELILKDQNDLDNSNKEDII